MSRLVGLGAFLLLTLTANAARADHVSDEQRAFLVPANETSDAWLHDRCAFRGLVDATVHDTHIAGQVLELVADGQSPLVKEFRCTERPPFLKGDFTAATPDALLCNEPKDPKSDAVCTPPLRPPPPPPPAPVVVATPEPTPLVLPEPPAPKKRMTKKKKK